MTDSRNVNDDDTLTGAFNVLINHINKRMQNSLPVRVTKVDDGRMTVSVQPQIMTVGSSGDAIQKAEIHGIPIATLGAGNFLMSPNVSAGDLGWISASDRDISIFKQSYEESKPNTERMHSYSDARFTPDVMTDFTIAGEDVAAFTIQNRAGTVKIALDEDSIRINKGGISLKLEGSSVNGVAPGGFNLNGFTIDASGAVESPVSITAPSAIIAGKEIAEHNHPAGTPPANTGPNN